MIRLNRLVIFDQGPVPAYIFCSFTKSRHLKRLRGEFRGDGVYFPRDDKRQRRRCSMGLANRSSEQKRVEKMIELVTQVLPRNAKLTVGGEESAISG